MSKGVKSINQTREAKTILQVCNKNMVMLSYRDPAVHTEKVGTVVHV